MTKNGLCCIHNGMKEKGYGFQTMTWKRFCDLGREAAMPILLNRYENNAFIVSLIIEECGKRGWNYRVSSDMFPLMTHPEANIKFEELSNRDILFSYLFRCCDMAKKYGVRLSCHPDQFNVLASENSKSVDQTITELNHHGWLMHLMGFYCDFYLKSNTIKDGIVQDCKQYNPGYGSPINIHLNCSKGDPKEIAKRFKDNLERLDKHTRSRLVLETEDKGIWHTRNLIEHIHSITGIPITFDYLHHKCNDGGLTEEEAFTMCAKTWGDNKPLFHFAESLPNQKNPRKHADIPTYLPNTYNIDVDLDFEFKHKELALEIAAKMANQLNVKEEEPMIVS